jgi:hypothetical protein
MTMLGRTPLLKPSLRQFLAGLRFFKDDDVKEAVKKWLSSEAVTFYEGIQKLVARL